MPKTLPFLLVLFAAGPALADESWDHRGMQSHHDAVDRAERPLAPGEKRIGRIEIGTVSDSTHRVPESLPATTQRQWIQRSSFSGGTPTSNGGSPRIQAGRHAGTPGVSHSSPSR